MDYTTLHGHLDKLERLVTLPSPPPGPSPGARACIRNNGGIEFQAFGLDRSTREKETLPVVIAVGANYTQANSPAPGVKVAPRDLLYPPSIVEDDLTKWRNSLNAGFKSYKNNPRLWKDQSAASSSSLHPPEEFHLVMTNFCLWITSASWLNIGSHLRADLLENNPSFSKCPYTRSNDWPHLAELNQVLKTEKPIWVAHGLGSEVFCLFKAFARNVGIEDWLLMPNLSRPYRYYSPKPDYRFP